MTTAEDVEDSGDDVVSLREAIVEANNTPGKDIINFKIPGAGVHTISPQSELPVIVEAVEINGYAQTGAQLNTLAVGNNAILRIELNGSQAGVANGLNLATTGCDIFGLVINSFAKAGIVIVGGGSHGILGNFIGTNATGSFGQGNGEEGIFIIDSSDNLIGSDAPDGRNVISGNGLDGVNHF